MKNSSSLLDKGFKAEAERKSIEFRKSLGLTENCPLPAEQLAEHLNITIYPLTSASQNVDCLKENISAFALSNEAGKRIIVHNDLHTKGRQQSNIMHELAHIICEHKVKDYGVPLPSNMRGYDGKNEQEAEYFGGCLQIPREALVRCVKNKMTNEAIADYFLASKEMVTYRINITGVNKQILAYNKYKK